MYEISLNFMQKYSQISSFCIAKVHSRLSKKVLCIPLFDLDPLFEKFINTK